MILFKNDWARYPTAIIHHKTRNTSFLRQAEVYKMMGIKNYAFHLALYQPDLELVDPHDPNLDPDTMAKIAVEVMYNPWYFFRECVRIPPQGSPKAPPLRANRGNIALIWLFMNHVDPALIQPRQTGKSVSTDCLMLYLLTWGCENATVNMLTKDDKLRTKNVDRLKKMRGYLPRYLQQIAREDSDNSMEITVKRRDNHYTTAVGQNSESAALNIGRGLTSPIAHIDEAPFINFVDTTIPAMLSAGNAARDEARDNGKPYGTIFTTTAGKKDSRSGRYMFNLIHGGMVWTEKLLDCSGPAELRKIVRANSPGFKPLVNITLSHRQLGYTDEWLYEKMMESNSQGEEADRDYFNRWTSGGLTSPLPTEINDRLRSSERDPDYLEISEDGYCLRWYIPENRIAERMASGKVVIGMDTSEAIGRDSITMVFVDPYTFDVIAAANVNEANLITFGLWVADLMIRYQNTILIPERRSSGQTIIDTLLIKLPQANIDPWRRIYNVVVDNSTKYEAEFKLLQYDQRRRPSNFNEKHKMDFGFATSGSGAHSRNSLYSTALQRAARIGSDKCYDKKLIDEITGLVTRNGRIDHDEDKNDDMVIAWLLAAWFLTASKNLQFYGLVGALERAKEYKPGAARNDKPQDIMDEYQDYRQKAIKAEMESLLESLKGTDDEFVTMRLEQRIKALDSRLVDKFSEVSSIDALISEARSSRRNAKRDVTAAPASHGVSSYRRRIASFY